jgi:RHS repeat-associated protein
VVWPRPSATDDISWACLSGRDPLEIPIDPNGNLASKVEGTDTWGYEWNARNELTRVTKDGGEQARFAYDPMGRRVERVAGGVTTNYTYDRADILREFRGESTFKYVHGPDTDEPLAREDPSGALNYYHPDGLGSVAKRTSQVGAVTQEYRYDAWGNIEVGASEPGFSFTSREWDAEIGVAYYRTRYYDPKVGRFLSEDPKDALRQVRGVPREYYIYVRNNPGTYIDPEGTDWKDPKWWVTQAKCLWKKHQCDKKVFKHCCEQNPYGTPEKYPPIGDGAYNICVLEYIAPCCGRFYAICTGGKLLNLTKPHCPPGEQFDEYRGESEK